MHMAVGCVIYIKDLHGAQVLNTWGVKRNQYLAVLTMAGTAGVGINHHNHNLAARVTGTRNPNLLAIQYPFITVGNTGHSNIGGI